MQVYKITNQINGKVYIGATKLSLKQRWAKHVEKSKLRPNNKFYSDINRYGVDNFRIERIAIADTWDVLYRIEAENIEKYNTIEDGYNTRHCAPTLDDWEEFYEAHSRSMRSADVRNKISATMKQRVHDGSIFTDAHRRKLSEQACGNTNGINNKSHSIPVYCSLSNGDKQYFRNIKEAGLWWYKTYAPFGVCYSQATYQRKILQCIELGYCVFKGKQYHFDIAWHKYEEGGGVQ